MRRAGAHRYTSARLSPATPRRLPHAFYARDAVAVARDLLGKVLVHQDGPTRRAARIVETEAYHGPDDQASHARFGRTPRAAIMFGPAGVAYVYLIYGLSHCFNVVTGEEGHPSAVLVRAAEPIEGCLHATTGPGNLCRALAIHRQDHNGADLAGGVLFVEDAAAPHERVVAARRVNVSFAGTWADRPWRFALAGNRYVSRPWPWAARRRRRTAPARTGEEGAGVPARGARQRRGRAVRSTP